MKTCYICEKRVSSTSQECPYCGCRFHDEDMHHQRNFSKKWIFIVSVIILVLILNISKFFIMMNTSTDNETVINSYSSESMSLDVAISQGYDHYDTMALTIEKEKEVYEFLKSLELSDIEKYEYWSDSYNTLYASAEVGGYKDGIYYEIDIAYANGVVDEESIYLERTFHQSILDEKSLNFDQDILSSLGDYLNIKDVYKTIDEKRVYMERKEDVMNYQDDKIDISECKVQDQYELSITIWKK